MNHLTFKHHHIYHVIEQPRNEYRVILDLSNAPEDKDFFLNDRFWNISIYTLK